MLLNIPKDFFFIRSQVFVFEISFKAIYINNVISITAAKVLWYYSLLFFKNRSPDLGKTI